MAVVSIAISYSVPLFALLMEERGASGTQIGINHMVAAFAMVLGAPIFPMLLGRIGLVPMMLCAVATLALVFIAIPVWPSQIWWAFLRMFFGFAATALFFASEYWLMSVAPDHLRGRLVGVYTVILSASYMLGPVLLNAIGLDASITYLAPALVICIAALPIVFGRGEAPPVTKPEKPNPFATLRFFVSDPMVLWGVVIFGVIEFGAMGLISIWALRTGFEQDTAIWMMFWLACGSLGFQIPIGLAADRFDRRILLTIAGIVSMIMPLVIVTVASDPFLVAGCIFVWGGMAVAFYTLALTELGSRYKGQVLAEGNAALVLAYGLGALIAPAAFGAAMDLIPPDGLLYLASAAAVAYCVLAAVRLSLARPPLDTRGADGR